MVEKAFKFKVDIDSLMVGEELVVEWVGTTPGNIRGEVGIMRMQPRHLHPCALVDASSSRPSLVA